MEIKNLTKKIVGPTLGNPMSDLQKLFKFSATVVITVYLPKAHSLNFIIHFQTEYFRS